MNTTVTEAPMYTHTIETTPAPTNALSIISDALKGGASPEVLRELLAVKKDWEADEARKAFNLAVSDFQRRCPIIEKADKAYDKVYARMDRIWREIRPLAGELGLSVTWQIAELRDGMCHVEGQLRHRDGHGERLSYDCPLPELIKGQNLAQQMASAQTYAKRYAMCAALGIVSGDDDDGHKAGTQYITHDQAVEINDMIEAAKGLATFNEKAFWGFAGASSAGEIAANRYAQVKQALTNKLKGGT